MKKEEKQNDIKMAELISISKAPTDIDVNDLEITKGQCILNSYLVGKKNPKVQIVEGLIIVFDTDNRATAMPHVWNKLGEIHFDVTKEQVWPSRKESVEVIEVKYFIVKTHSPSDLRNGNKFEFSSDTYENVAAANNTINPIQESED